MKAAAYAHAEGSRVSNWIRLGQYVDRFGGPTVFGRPIGANEMYCIITSENIVNAFNARGPADKWEEWARANKSESKRLNQAMILAHNMGMIDG